MNTVFVLFCDKNYFHRACRTINDLRIVGEWSGDIVKKLVQWSKFYIFDIWFKQWSTVVYLDAGIRVCNPVADILNLPCKDHILAPDDSQPDDNGNRFKCQLDLDACSEKLTLLKENVGEDILSKRYFISCVLIYDTGIINEDTVQTLITLMNMYPICRTNDTVILNLYFTFKRDLWIPLPEQMVDTTYFYGWSELNYRYDTKWFDFIFLKYSVTLDFDRSPLRDKLTFGVAIPCYKPHIRHLGRLLESIQAQTVLPDHVVVSCSSSTLSDIPFKNSDYLFNLDILVIENAQNTAQNRNNAVKHLKTDIISFFDADDVMHPQRIEAIQNAYNKYACDLVLHDYYQDTTVHLHNYSQFNYQPNDLSRAPCGCAVVNSNISAGIHHAQVSVLNYYAHHIYFHEEEKYELSEDSIFCGDVLAQTTNAVYINNKLSVYYQDGSKYGLQKPMLIPELCGGLGNMMFQLASVYGIAKDIGYSIGLYDIEMPPNNHSKTDYKQGILKPWLRFKTLDNYEDIYIERDMAPVDMDWLTSGGKRTILMKGYFQDEAYIRKYYKEIVNMFDLTLPDYIIQKYNDIEDAYFLHVRRGDYVANSFHELYLDNYYREAIKKMHGTAYVFSNDLEWCANWEFLKNVRHRLIDERDDYCIALMSKCGVGGIAANSSYSWWGLYLNINRPKLYIPEKWFPHDIVRQDGYRFKEATIQEL